MRVISKDEKPITAETPDESIEKTEEVAAKYNKECPLSEKMIEKLVKQMGVELSNFNLYNNFSNYFKKQGLFKLQFYYTTRANEEKHHFDWIKNYLEYQDAEFTIPAIEQVNTDIKDNIFPFQATVDREVQTTEEIYDIMDLALEEKDYSTICWLNGTAPVEGKLIPEQIEEMHISRSILKLALIGDADWLSIQDVVYSHYFNT